MNLLSELYDRVNQTTECWGNIQSIHLTVQLTDRTERTYVCPHMSDSMSGVVERFLEHISAQTDICEIVGGCVWFVSGNILMFQPNDLIKQFLCESGHWEFIALPINPKDVDDLNAPGMEWLTHVYPNINRGDQPNG